MHFHVITIFPEILQSFVSTSLISKAILAEHIHISTINPRSYTTDPHQQVDDEIYGGGHGLLMKARPIIDAIISCRDEIYAHNSQARIQLVMVGPSDTYFDQATAHTQVDIYTDIIYICGRYEGVDHRVCVWAQDQFGADFVSLSLGRFIVLGGEVPAMTMIEAVARLVPGVIRTDASRQQESYIPEHNCSNLEHPQYTRPLEVMGYAVPDVLISGHHQRIQDRKNENSSLDVS